jgi:hypothetical protein
MTPQTHVLPDPVEDMLLDAGFGQDDRLRSALLSLGSLASLPAPVPSGELAALLADDGSRLVGGELGRRRWLRAQRPTVVGLALIAGMGMGVGGVAASSLPSGHSGSPSIQHMLQDWAPAWTLPAEELPGSSGGSVEPEVSDPDESEAVASQGATVPGAGNPAVPSRGPAPADIPASSSHVIKGTGQSPTGAGQGLAKGRGADDAGAAAAKTRGVAGAPEQAAGQGNDAGSDAPGQLAGAVPGVLADVAGGTLQATADTAGAALTSIPGNSWLQKFNR